MKSINLQRTESLLVELIPQALGELNDSRINSLAILAVDCKNGKYDARVYFDASDYSKDEIKVLESLLKKANSRIKSFCLNATGWYKCPNFTFLADHTLENEIKIENLFKKIQTHEKED